MFAKKVWCAAVSAGLLAGCATKDFVTEQIVDVEARQATVDYAQNADIAQLSASVQEALDRANVAFAATQGDGMSASIFAMETIQFTGQPYELSDDARAALDDLVVRLRAAEDEFYIEIQGHTDATGSVQANHVVGTRRAEAVRVYLNQQGIPLRYLSTISYGPTAPVAPNDTVLGRSANRRAEVIVLQ
jgi:outer membrane protein OmpA-like peptidoglycan-associated protein